MKKLLLVPVIAALAAAGSASAAGLNVLPGAPLQTGTTTALSCTDNARVTQWGTDEGNGAGPVVHNVQIELAANHTCAGRMFVTLLGAGNEELATGKGSVITTPGQRQPERVTFNPALTRDQKNNTNPKAAVVEGVRITIDQGFVDYSTAGTPGR